jgi:5-formyltetrahydrofolate cyclo-ligase
LLAPVSSSPSRRKPATRRTLLARRDALSAVERSERSAKITEGAIALLERSIQTGGVVGLYAAKGSEVETTAIDEAARARGIVVAYPRVVGDARPLAFHAVRLDELVPARFGLREPPPDVPEIELAGIAAFFLPGLAFDRAGGRVGWGRGHYDATLAAAPRALRVGLAFDFQLVDAVPSEAHDVPLHAIITEVATYTVA